MADYATARSSVISRSGSLLNRPHQVPLGPRTRNNRASNLLSPEPRLHSSPSLSSLSSSSSGGRPISTLSNPPYLPEFGPSPITTASLNTITETSDAYPNSAVSASEASLQSPSSPPQSAEPLPAYERTPANESHQDDPHTTDLQPPIQINVQSPAHPPEQYPQDLKRHLEEQPEQEEQPGEAPQQEEGSQNPVVGDDVGHPSDPVPETVEETPKEETPDPVMEQITEEVIAETLQDIVEEESQEVPQESYQEETPFVPEDGAQVPQDVPEDGAQVPQDVPEVLEDAQKEAPREVPEPAVSTPSSIPISLPSTNSPRVPSPMLSYGKPKLIAPIPKLTPPHSIKFESVPVQWKGLPLDAAMWTFDSKELQAIVSRAIRSSARESYVRLLAIDILDNVLPAEIERLEGSRAMTQAKYRFLVNRRTMQLQALLSSTLATPNAKDKENEDGILTATKLVVQISETTAQCDQLMEELLKISDQLGQIKRLLDHHWASSLAIALRKLNGSYGRRTADLLGARERIEQLEAELEEAWAEAAKLAQEMDELDEASDDEAIIETAEIVSLNRTTTPGPDSRPLSPIRSIPTVIAPTYAEIANLLKNPHRPPNLNLNEPDDSPLAISPLSPTTPLAIRSAVPKRQSNGIEDPVDVPDSVSIKSSRSAKSWKSQKSTGRETRVSIVSAARKRSVRASQSSLRLPPGFSPGHKRSGSRPKTPFETEDQPPVPTLPAKFSNNTTSHQAMPSTSSTTASSSGIQFDDISIDVGSETSIRFRRRPSLDSAHFNILGNRAPLQWQGGMDDLYVKTTSPRNDASATYHPASISRPTTQYRFDNEIDEVPRTPPPVPPKPEIVSMEEFSARPRPLKQRPLEAFAGGSIPSIWMNIDNPKTPAERLDADLHGPSGSAGPGSTNSGNSSYKVKTYEKLRGLTKRYSLSLPLFNKSANINTSGSQHNLADRSMSNGSG
ncbi:hypothetical protein FA15DRAFT_663759 [Coprinopsis marcescibilis]|uniref:Uncharacterized protein n=1 Tax=Coprinopsis marcescibilis TaxID=230819 RepID=A0A5C3LLQ5_COPMA|nr:hypothetical protein FA15DRAFT_663759 [Coprinopsis marcescibilis]